MYTKADDSNRRMVPLLRLQRGMPVVIRGTANEFVELGLANGVTGQVWDTVCIPEHRATVYTTRDQMATYCANNHFIPPIVIMQIDKPFWKTYTDEHGTEHD
jgi:hypothetical protein